MVGERIDVTVSEKDIVHLMGVLSEVYTNPTEAVAREYITNALDSHIEAGTTRPVEVTLPNVWQSSLIVEDFGIGMNKEDIRNTYSRYGASTKRESNDFNGMLGIGSKAAFAYTGSFSVIGIKDGIKTIVSVQRDEMGKPSMDILSETKTSERNGVKITIPVSNTLSMSDAINRVCGVLPEGKVLVNGKDVSDRKHWTLLAKNITDDDGNVIVENLWQRQGSLHNSRIIMGNVAYALTEHAMRLDWIDRHSSALVAEIPIGGAVFAPSREKLMDVPKTRATEEFIVSRFNSVRAKHLYDKVVNAPTRMEAMKQHHAVAGVLKVGGYTNVLYKGEAIPPLYERIMGSTDNRLVGWSFSLGYGRGLHALHYLNRSHFTEHGAVITGVPDDTPTSHYRRKIRQYFQNEPNVRSVIILPERTKTPKDKWLDNLRIVTHETIKEVKLPRPVRTGGGGGGGISTKGKHFAWDATKVRYELREVDSKEKVYYIIKSQTVSEWNFGKFGAYGDTQDQRFSNLSNVIAESLPEGSVLVHVYANRLTKFKEDYPNAVALTEEAAHGMMVDALIKDVSDGDIAGYQAHRVINMNSETLALIPDDDKDKPKDTSGDSYTKVYNALRLLPPDHAFRKKVDKAEADMRKAKERLTERYPLIAVGNLLYRVSNSALKRYFEADYNKSQEEE